MGTIEANKILAGIWNDIQRTTRETQAREAKTNPDKYRLSRVMDGRANYCYYSGGYIRRSKTKIEGYDFCWTVNRNIGGQFLAFVQIKRYRNGKAFEVERINFTYTDSKKDAIKTSERRRDNWRKNNPTATEFMR